MSQLTKIFNCAIQELSDNTYAGLYKKWMGLTWPKPETNQVLQHWLSWDQIDEDSPLKRENPVIKVGFYPHAPFCAYNEETHKIEGFEYDLCKEFIKIINAKYPELEGKLDTEWIAEDIPDEKMGDGRDNMTIQEYMNPGLYSGKYDLVFTGVFYGGPDGQNEFCHPTMRFWVGPICTGLDNVNLDGLTLGGNTLENLAADPLGNLPKLVEAFRNAGVKQVVITNTPSSKQVGYGRDIADSFLLNLEDAFYVTQKIQWVDGIKEDIEGPFVHIYVGDLIQVQVMHKNRVGTNLDMQFGDSMFLAPYTYNPDAAAPEASSSQQQKPV